MAIALDLFCGAGGFSCGAIAAGIEVVAGIDNEPLALETYARNLKRMALHCDLENVNATLGITKHCVPDIVFGGPPCQDSSAANRSGQKGRNRFMLHFADIVIGLAPKVVVFENVVGAQKKAPYRKAVSLLQKGDYGITCAVLDASHFGVPQARKRLFTIGIKGGRKDAVLPFLEVRASTQPMTVAEYQRGSGFELDVEHYYSHPRGKSRRGIFSIHEPAPTIRCTNRPLPASYAPHARDSAPADSGIRSLTSEERAWIQTFPRDWVWRGASSRIDVLVGNAVPVVLAKTVFEAIGEYMRTVEDRDLF